MRGVERKLFEMAMAAGLLNPVECSRIAVKIDCTVELIVFISSQKTPICNTNT